LELRLSFLFKAHFLKKGGARYDYRHTVASNLELMEFIKDTYNAWRKTPNASVEKLGDLG
jgi:hypothetical protein